MKSISMTRFAFLFLLFLIACQKGEPQTPTPIALDSSPTPDQTIIKPENADRLVQIKQIGMGMAIAAPLYSPDGKLLYQATTTGIFVFDLASHSNGDLLLSYPDIHYTTSLDISDDGSLLSVRDEVVTASGMKLPAPEKPSGLTRFESVKISPDGTLVARSFSTETGGAVSHVGVWRTTDGKLLHTFVLDPYAYNCCSFDFSPDGLYLYIGSGTHKRSEITLYNLNSGELLATWPGSHAFFLPENLIVVESEGVVRIYDLETYLAHHVFYGEFAAISPEGQTMALLNFGQFKTYSISDEQLLNTFEGDFSGIDEAILQFSHDGKWLAGYSIQNFCCLGKDESLSLWRVSDGKLIKKFEQPSALFNFSPTNNNLAITLRLGGTYIFNADDASQIAEVGMYNSQVTSVSFYSTGHDLVVATAENNSSQYYDFPGDYQPPLFFYDVDSGILFNNQPATMYNVPVALSTDGKIYAPDDLRDLPSIKELENIGSIAFSPDGKKVAIGATNGLFIWDIPSKTLLLHGGVGQYTSIDFSPDGQKVATARVNEGIMSHEEGTTISIWEAIHGGNRLTDLVPGLGVNTVSYSPDGRFIAAGGKDGVTVWSIPGANILFRINNGIKGYSPIGALGIQRMAFSPDSRIFAVGFVDGTIQLWDTNRVRRIITLKVTDTPFNSINDLDFSSDGKLLAAGLEDGSVRIFGIK